MPKPKTSSRESLLATMELHGIGPAQARIQLDAAIEEATGKVAPSESFDRHLLKFEFIADRDGKVSIWCKPCDKELHTDIETMFQAWNVAIPHTCPSDIPNAESGKSG